VAEECSPGLRPPKTRFPGGRSFSAQPHVPSASTPPLSPRILFKHVASNWSRNLLQILVMLVLSPLMEEKLGRDGYGIWFAIIAATGFLELLALGVPMASVRHISEAVTSGDTERTNRMIATGYGITIGLGLIGAVLGAALFFPFERGLIDNETFQNARPSVLEAARVAYLITAVRVAAALALRFPTAVFDSKQDFVTKNLIQNAGILFRALAVGVVLYVDPSLVWIAWIFVVEAVAVFLAFRFFIHRRFEGLQLSLRHFDRGMVRELVGFGLFAAILNVGTMIAYNIDALVIGRLIGPEAITDFDFGNKFFIPLAAIMYGVGAVVMPTATKIQGEEDAGLLQAVFLKWSKISLSVVLPICLFLAVLGPRFLAAWVGPEYEESAGRVTRILAPSFLLALPVRAVALPILLGTTSPGRPALIYLGAAMLNLTLSIVLVKAGYGIVGVALGTAIPQVLFAGYLVLVTCMHLNMKAGAWLSYVGGKALFGALPCVALLLWFERGLGVRGYAELTAAGIAFVVLFGVVWTLFVYRGDPHLDLREELALRLRRGR
jgi:O-antigen/teichoic acid export membrane protein